MKTSKVWRAVREAGRVALCLVPLSLVTAAAGAAETDRVVVQDPATGAVVYRVTSAGNVFGSSFNGPLVSQQGPTEPGTAPKFSVLDNTGKNKLYFTPNGNLWLDSSLQLTMWSDNAGARPTAGFKRARGTATAPLMVQTEDKVGTFQMQAWDGTAYQAGGLIEGFVDGTPSAGSVPTRISIVTGANANDRAERLVVKSSGNVGIGTSAPSQMLEVAGTIKSQALDVAGAVKISSSGTRPECGDATRGTFWFNNGGAGSDSMQVCAKVLGVYIWKALW